MTAGPRPESSLLVFIYPPRDRQRVGLSEVDEFEKLTRVVPVGAFVTGSK